MSNTKKSETQKVNLISDDVLKTSEEVIISKIQLGSKAVPQEIYVIEEMSECIKELTKFLRQKGDKEHLTEEIADVFATLIPLTTLYGIDLEEVKEKCLFKLNRAIERNKIGDV